ncbi:aspartic peptidase domain-containing protein [Calycina marina]|uniref:Aspartic peptidase domain-containing protein n=1 Tax=Calycina marina TaxID=1763456 RepID=A0A9P7YUL5_9HELO|nr:aspartic peptidase domain-containing protein [Calycina marina]
MVSHFKFLAFVLAPILANAAAISVAPAKAVQSRSELVASSNVIELTKKTSVKGYNPRSAAFLKHKVKPSTSTGTSTLVSLFEGEEFATNITFGSQTFEVIVDTGSSDTWVVETGFACVDIETEAPLTEADCYFGPTFTPKNFSQIANENFNITYGDGEFLSGVLGYEQVTLAGITVTQEVAVVNYAAWEGDEETSGLVGLAYPALTSAYSGSDPHNDTVQDVYNGIITTMIKDGAIEAPLFSLAILRDVSGPSGYLALGGLPPVDFVQEFATTPILVTTIDGYPQTYDFYTIEVDGMTLNGNTLNGAATPKYIVDSGTTLNYLPTSISDAINKAFIPPAVYEDDEGAYIVDCKAKAPTFGITIGGTTFYTNPLDMILLAGTDDDGNDVCISGIDDGGNDDVKDVFILGDTFQKNVVVVFDVGAAELHFAAREFYPSNDAYKQ